MRIAVDELLEKKGKSRYWLSKQTGITYANISRLCNNETVSIKFAILEKICVVLECSPNDILILEKGDDSNGKP